MSDSIKYLSNIRSLRAGARQVPLPLLEELLGKLLGVVEERRNEEETQQSHENLRRHTLDKLRHILVADGIDPAELTGLKEQKKKSVSEPLPARFEFTDENGEKKTWTGKGRRPKHLSHLIAAGAKLSDFAIHKMK